MTEQPELKIDSFGTKRWYVKNNLHRTDGPAVEFINGGNSWYLNNIKYSFDNWLVKSNKTPKEIVYFKLKYS